MDTLITGIVPKSDPHNFTSTSAGQDDRMIETTTERRVPFGFFGTHIDRYTTMSVGTMDREFALMSECGVERLRVTFLWNQIQMWYPPRYHGVIHTVTDFLRSDAIVGAAARAGLEMVGTVWGAPPWATGGLRPGESSRFAFTAFGGVPEHSEDIGNFMGDLIERYGPNGTFWAENPGISARPIRIWQPWQEPDRPAFMPQPFDVGYFVEMAHVCYKAVKSADPGAMVLGTGIGPAAADSKDLLDSIYRAGYKGAADAIGLHVFPRNAEAMLDAIRMNREVMADHGDGNLPIVMSQISYSSALGKSRIEPPNPNMYDEAGQAAQIRETLAALAEHREELNIFGAYYHGWSGLDEEPPAPRAPDPWIFTGLRKVTKDGTMISKPALDAYRDVVLALEGKDSRILSGR
ncbi:MAG: hypothetical protein NTU93_01855 [Arthrobacter sp.]|nr:hypothetical protein [Arthrobacter sp.]